MVVNSTLFDKVRKELCFEIGERFKIDDTVCYFDEERFHADTTYIDKEACMFFRLMMGKTRIQRQKRIPVQGETYYYLEKYDEVANSTWDATETDLSRYILGNCFTDVDEAEKHKGIYNTLLEKAKELEKQNKKRFM